MPKEEPARKLATLFSRKAQRGKTEASEEAPSCPDQGGEWCRTPPYPGKGADAQDDGNDASHLADALGMRTSVPLAPAPLAQAVPAKSARPKPRPQSRDAPSAGPAAMPAGKARNMAGFTEGLQQRGPGSGACGTAPGAGQAPFTPLSPPGPASVRDRQAARPGPAGGKLCRPRG